MSEIKDKVVTVESLSALHEYNKSTYVDKTDVVSVANGGTGATDVETARANLDAAPSSHTHSASDINSGCVPLNRGGTGTTVDLENAPVNAIIKKAGEGYNQLYYTATGNGAFYATEANGVPQFGTLPVAQGGTGKATNTSNAILTGNGANAVKNVATKSGAFYATAANGAAQFGTLPVAQGGTGVTTEAGIGLLAYPVGSIYMSVNSTPPSELFGGKWTQLKNRFLLGASDTYEAGDTGGEATHKLTAAEMPSHAHVLSLGGGTDDYGMSRSIVTEYTKGTSGFGDTTAIHAAGSGQAHNNMPPYLVVYMWKRTA